MQARGFFFWSNSDMKLIWCCSGVMPVGERWSWWGGATCSFQKSSKPHDDGTIKKNTNQLAGQKEKKK
jgi:hypothetical protein